MWVSLTGCVVTASFVSALAAARAAAGSQDYPPGALYMVATPIGNMADITLRGLYVLDLVDAIACEDSRHTGQLLQTYGLSKPLMPVHMHNEREGAQRVLDLLGQGKRVAYVSDAGTPGISDPGALLAHTVRAAGRRVVPLPGASSVSTMLSAWGESSSAADWSQQGFWFAGFLPSKGADRAAALAKIQASPCAALWLEAPHRLTKLAAEVQTWQGRTLSIGRELTKRFETIDTLACDQLVTWLAQDPQRQKGEFVFALHKPEPAAEATGAGPMVQDTLNTLLAHVPLKTAVQLTVKITGVSKNVVYETALRLAAGGEAGDGE